MIIYLDSDFKCHAFQNEHTILSVETSFFYGKCAAFIEGYRYVPHGEEWVRPDGNTFCGEMIAPWKPWEELDAAQREYERELLVQYEAALSEIESALGVSQ